MSIEVGDFVLASPFYEYYRYYRVERVAKKSIKAKRLFLGSEDISDYQILGKLYFLGSILLKIPMERIVVRLRKEDVNEKNAITCPLVCCIGKNHKFTEEKFIEHMKH